MQNGHEDHPSPRRWYTPQDAPAKPSAYLEDAGKIGGRFVVKNNEPIGFIMIAPATMCHPSPKHHLFSLLHAPFAPSRLHLEREL